MATREPYSSAPSTGVSASGAAASSSPGSVRSAAPGSSGLGASVLGTQGYSVGTQERRVAGTQERRVVDDAADALESLGTMLLRDVQALARRQPAGFFVGALVIGA